MFLPHSYPSYNSFLPSISLILFSTPLIISVLLVFAFFVTVATVAATAITVAALVAVAVHSVRAISGSIPQRGDGLNKTPWKLIAITSRARKPNYWPPRSTRQSGAD